MLNTRDFKHPISIVDAIAHKKKKTGIEPDEYTILDMMDIGLLTGMLPSTLAIEHGIGLSNMCHSDFMLLKSFENTSQYFELLKEKRTGKL